MKLSARKAEHQNQLSAHLDQIKFLYQQYPNIRVESLRAQLTFLKKHIQGIDNIKATTFSKFVKKKLKFSFKKICYISKNADSEKNKNVRVLFLKLLVVFLFNNWVVCFTDTTVLCSNSLKPYAWGHRSERIYLPQVAPTKRKHFLTAMSQYCVEACYITPSGASLEELISFYNLLCETLKSKYKRRKIVVVLDNAKKLHSNSLKEIANDHQILFLYTASSSPSLHPIEYLFEQAKRKVRLSTRIIRFVFHISTNFPAIIYTLSSF